MSSDQIERETLIAAPVDRVWSVLTEAEHLQAWFAGSGAEIDLRPGGAITLHFAEAPGSVTRARVEVVEPPRRFAWRWTAHHAPGEEPGEGTSTRVEFTLTPEGGGTRLRVVETGFDSLDASPEQREANHGANVRGWGHKLGDLEAYAAGVAT